MEELKRYAADAWEELDGAKHYAEMAMKAKPTDINTANQYSEMARQELAHYDNIAKMAQRHIEAHKNHPDHYHVMKTVWDWEWDKMADKAAKINAMLAMAR